MEKLADGGERISAPTGLSGLPKSPMMVLPAFSVDQHLDQGFTLVGATCGCSASAKVPDAAADGAMLRPALYAYEPLCLGSNYSAISSLAGTSSASAMSYSRSKSSPRLPFSTSLRIGRVTPDFSANCSWVRPRFCRNSRIRLPTDARRRSHAATRSGLF